MFTIVFRTTAIRPDSQVTIRTRPNWDRDIAGLYDADAWTFALDEDDYPAGLEFKFVLERTYWMDGPNLVRDPIAGRAYEFTTDQIVFPPLTELVVENSAFQARFFEPGSAAVHYDVIIVGSGVGGGVLADALSDLGVDVLVLEAGSLLFPTHVANLPRRHVVGRFDKHVWDLYAEYRIRNFNNAPGSEFDGGQAFNLGGRSLFWGGLIPRMTAWELSLWPPDLAGYLETAGYQQAEDLIYWPASPPGFQKDAKRLLDNVLPDYYHYDAPIGVREPRGDRGSLAAGLFSTADLLTESRLTIDSAGNAKLTINLNHAVTRLDAGNGRIDRVIARDLIAGVDRAFTADAVVLCAGTIESAKLAMLSDLRSASGLVGKGLTDHPIFYTHFSIPAGAPYNVLDSFSKTLSRHKQAAVAAHPYNMVLELGADLNQGRYLDPDILARHNAEKHNATLCEIVFLFNAPLVAGNSLVHAGPAYVKPVVDVRPSPSANDHVAEVTNVKNAVVAALAGEALPGGDLALRRAALGGVAHEVGTLRLGAPAGSVVDTNLKWHEYANLYVCDLSVFPTSPAANPTLTLAALALRLARHLADSL